VSIAEHEVTEGGEGAPELLNVWLRWRWTAAVAWDDVVPHRKDGPHLALWVPVDLSTYHVCTMRSTCFFIRGDSVGEQREKECSLSSAGSLGLAGLWLAAHHTQDVGSGVR
jgi:hypothetical protein